MFLFSVRRQLREGGKTGSTRHPPWDLGGPSRNPSGPRSKRKIHTSLSESVRPRVKRRPETSTLVHGNRREVIPWVVSEYRTTETGQNDLTSEWFLSLGVVTGFVSRTVCHPGVIYKQLSNIGLKTKVIFLSRSKEVPPSTPTVHHEVMESRSRLIGPKRGQDLILRNGISLGRWLLSVSVTTFGRRVTSLTKTPGSLGKGPDSGARESTFQCRELEQSFFLSFKQDYVSSVLQNKHRIFTQEWLYGFLNLSQFETSRLTITTSFRLLMSPPNFHLIPHYLLRVRRTCSWGPNVFRLDLKSSHHWDTFPDQL